MESIMHRYERTFQTARKISVLIKHLRNLFLNPIIKLALVAAIIQAILNFPHSPDLHYVPFIFGIYYLIDDEHDIILRARALQDKLEI